MGKTNCSFQLAIDERHFQSYSCLLPLPTTLARAVFFLVFLAWLNLLGTCRINKSTGCAHVIQTVSQSLPVERRNTFWPLFLSPLYPQTIWPLAKCSFHSIWLWPNICSCAQWTIDYIWLHIVLLLPKCALTLLLPLTPPLHIFFALFISSFFRCFLYW